tara:strand:+ start:1897 stop:2754 length:858 start_codon:yes stop_codon:yes gene_type:complete
MTNKTKKDLTIVAVLIIAAFFIMKMHQEREVILEPIQLNEEIKAVHISYTYDTNAVEIGDEYICDVYAGRYDEIKDAQYNSLGLPVDRYWMTSKEWHGRHITKMDLNKTKKRLLMQRFKMWKKNHIKTFIDEMLQAAIKERETFPQIPPSLIVAQAIIESNFGLSRLALQANNYFGHKYRGKNAKKFIIAADDSPTDRFTKYKSTWFSLRHHTKNVLMRLYYPRCNGKSDLNSWLHALCGAMTAKQSASFVKKGNYVYATSCMTKTCYAKKLKTIIKTYKLDKYD